MAEPSLNPDTAEPSLNPDTAEPSSNPDTANAPPSTADTYVQPLPRDFPPDYDLATRTHRHSILAMVPQSDGSGSDDDNDNDNNNNNETDPLPVALCHWHPPTVSHVEMPPAEVAPRLFSVIKDAQPLGTFCLPDDVDVAAALSDRLAALPEDDLGVGGDDDDERARELELTPQRLAGLMGGLEVPEGGAGLRFFAFPVFSDSEQEVVGKGLCPVWKWAKPESIYRKVGSWETSLHGVLDDGEWNGGRNLLLLTKGVSEETLKEMELGEKDGPSSPGSPLRDSQS